MSIVLLTDEEATTPQIFHNIEFSAAWIFAIVQLLAVFYAFDRVAIMSRPWILKMVVFLNLGGSIVPAVLVYVNVEEFEVPSHEIEYANTIFAALIDVLMAVEIIQSHYHAGKTGHLLMNIAIVLLPVCIALAMLVVYNAMGIDDEGEHRGEAPSHYLEFSFEMVSSLITFSYCMDNKLRADLLRSALFLSNDPLAHKSAAAGGTTTIQAAQAEVEIVVSAPAPAPASSGASN